MQNRFTAENRPVDDEIDSIRRFDPETQRSAATVERVACFRAEFPSMNRASCSLETFPGTI